MRLLANLVKVSTFSTESRGREVAITAVTARGWGVDPFRTTEKKNMVFSTVYRFSHLPLQESLFINTTLLANSCLIFLFE
jgi:hypothetical protein